MAGRELAGDLVGCELPQPQLTAALEELVDGEGPLEDEVAAVFDLRDRIEAREIDLLALLVGELRPQDEGACASPGFAHRAQSSPGSARAPAVSQPRGIVDVGLAARHILHVRSVCQHQLKFAIIQDVPHRLPIDAGRLHGHMRATVDRQPLRQAQKVRRGRLEVRTSVVTLPSDIRRRHATTVSL